jgi:diguanylate cyclase (GGDEF)-like protein
MKPKRDDQCLEQVIQRLLEDPQYEGNDLREPLAALFQRYQDHLIQLERLTSISDGYQTALLERSESIAERYHKQIRQLYKIVRISDHYQEMLREMNETLRVASTEDPLTGLANRRLMLDRLTAETALSERRRSPFSIAVIDVDHFKQINDRYGHDVGDAVLICLARALIHEVRAYDICARWGGEEFMTLLPETAGSDAFIIADRLRKKLWSFKAPEMPPDLRISVSIGVAEHRLDTTLTDTIKLADRALYQAKDAGRNCVILAE